MKRIRSIVRFDHSILFDSMHRKLELHAQQTLRCLKPCAGGPSESKARETASWYWCQSVPGRICAWDRVTCLSMPKLWLFRIQEALKHSKTFSNILRQSQSNLNMHQWWADGTACRGGMCEFATWTDLAPDRLPWSPLPASPASIWPSPLSMTRVAVASLQRGSRSSSSFSVTFEVSRVPIQFFNSPHSRPRLARAVLLRENEEESQLRMQENGHQKFCVPHPHAAAERNIHSQTHRQSVEYTIDYRFSLFRIYPYFSRSECPEGARSIFYLFCQWFCLSHRSCIVAMGCCCGKKKPPAKTPAEPPQAPPEPEVAASVHTGS